MDYRTNGSLPTSCHSLSKHYNTFEDRLWLRCWCSNEPLAEDVLIWFLLSPSFSHTLGRRENQIRKDVLMNKITTLQEQNIIVEILASWFLCSGWDARIPTMIICSVPWLVSSLSKSYSPSFAVYVLVLCSEAWENPERLWKTNHHYIVRTTVTKLNLRPTTSFMATIPLLPVAMEVVLSWV